MVFTVHAGRISALDVIVGRQALAAVVPSE
jgi:hypothetical protein